MRTCGSELPIDAGEHELSPETQKLITDLVNTVLEEIILPLAKAAAPHVKTWLVDKAGQEAHRVGLYVLQMERTTRFELATLTLARIINPSRTYSGIG